MGAERDGLDHVGAAHEAAIDHDLGPAGDGGGDLGQDIDGGAAVVKLAATVVGDVDHIDAVPDGNLGVLGGRDALDDQGDVMGILEALHVVPVPRRLKAKGGEITGLAGGRPVTLHQVALAPSIKGQVDSETNRAAAAVDGPLDELGDPGVVAANVYLVDHGTLGLGSDLLNLGLGQRTEEGGDAEFVGRPDDAFGARRFEQLKRTHGGDAHRQAHRLAEEFGRAIDLGDVAAHPRAQPDAVQPQPVALERGLGFAAAGQIVPRALCQIGPCGAGDLLQCLKVGHECPPY